MCAASPHTCCIQAGVLSGELQGVRVRQAWQAELGRIAERWLGEEAGGIGEAGGEEGEAGEEEESEEAREARLQEEEEEEATARYLQSQNEQAEG